MVSLLNRSQTNRFGDMYNESGPSLVLVVWVLEDVCEIVWWLGSSESILGSFCILDCISWERSDYILEELATSWGGRASIVDASWKP